MSQIRARAPGAGFHMSNTAKMIDARPIRIRNHSPLISLRNLIASNLGRADHKRPARDIDKQRQVCYLGCTECDYSNNNSDDSDDKMKTPVGVRRTTGNRPDNAKYAVHKHPRSEENYQ